MQNNLNFHYNFSESGKYYFRINKKDCLATYFHIDDVLSLNNPRFGDYLDHIYPAELEIRDTTDSAKSVSYLDLLLEIEDE